MGINCESIGVGSTPALSQDISWKGCTEIHPGNYIFYDRFQATIGSCNFENVACSVLTTVIGHYPSRNQFVIDAGALALSKDTGPTEGKDWGIIRNFPQLKIISISQEVGIVEGKSVLNYVEFPIGRKLFIIPNHSCLTAALYPEYLILENQKIIEKWRTCPRGW